MYISTKHLSKFIDIKNIKIEDLYSIINAKIIELDGSNPLVEATNLTVGFIESKVKHPDADKLNICQVNIGDEVLQIVCGAKNVDAGQHVIVALVGAILPGNFKIKKSKIRGVESFGMICSLSELGIEEKYQSEIDKEGISVLTGDVEAGNSPVEALGFDTHIFELGLTPNRMDLLSYEGFAYDLAAALDKDVLFTEDVAYKGLFDSSIKLNIDSELCKYYSVIEINDIVVKDSTDDIKSFLISNGIKPINNIVDATNVAMLETGCPLHAFDKEFVGNDISVELSNNDKVITLDSSEIKLSENDLVIKSNNEVISIAGIIGGLKSGIKSTTTNIILEGAHFNEVSIRKTSSRINVRTDSSVRFERKVSSEKITKSMIRFLEIIGYEGSNVLSSGSSLQTDVNISVTNKMVNNYLGTELSEEELVSILTRLKIKYNNGNLSLPKHRLDLESFQDIAEEVARIYGFENIPSTLPKNYSKNIGLTDWQRFIRKVRNILVGIGLDETKTYSLVSGETNELFSDNQDTTKLLMPLSKEREYLRTEIIPSIVDVVEYNDKRDQKDVAIFEIGDIYNHGQSCELTIALKGSLYQSSWQEDSGFNYKNNEVVDFYTIKGILEELLMNFETNCQLRQTDELKSFHPGRTANILMDDDSIIGVVGQLHPTYLNGKDLDETYVMSISLDLLFEYISDFTYFKDIPKFPMMKRDLAIVADLSVSVDDIKNICKSTGKKLLKSIEVFDIYTGDKVEDGKKSIGITLMFEDLEKTLETEDVTNRVNKILKNLKEHLGAELRTK